MDTTTPHPPPSSRGRRLLATGLAVAGIAVAVPAAAAIAAGGADGTNGRTAPEAPAGQLAPVQDSQAPDRRDGDCPERGGSQSAPDGAGSDATAL